MNTSVSATLPNCDYQHHRCADAASTQANSANWQHHVASLIIDIKGYITECNLAATHLLDNQTHELSGHSVTEIIPELPFSPDTPFYNLAYAIFHSSDEMPMQLATDGQEIPIDINLSSAVMNGKRYIKLNLKPSSRSMAGNT